MLSLDHHRRLTEAVRTINEVLDCYGANITTTELSLGSEAVRDINLLSRMLASTEVPASGKVQA